MKTRITYIAFILLLGSLQLKAGDGKSYISLKGAASMPIGKYGSDNLSNGCFTTTGFSAGVEGAWFFYKNIGAGIDFNFSLHPVDAVALATETVQDDPVMEDLTVRSDPYNIKTYMVGLLYKFQLTEKISVSPRVYGGLMYGRTPFQLYDASYFMLGPKSFKKRRNECYL
jgi:hypothetical protein